MESRESLGSLDSEEIQNIYIVQNPDLPQKEKNLEENGIGFWEAWRIPNVMRYAFVYSCVKGATLGLLFWLPFYFRNYLGLGPVILI